MKKTYLLFLFFCLSIVSVAIAQQKTPVKKANPPKIKPPKIYNVPPPPAVPKQMELKTANPSVPDVSYGPTIMADPSMSKFQKSMICQDCDTLKLESNKPSIVIYDVKWMADTESRTFRNQPTEKDLTNDYFALNGINKREWDELKKNFPEGDFNYHYVYRSTFITTPNNKRQTFSLLDRSDRHEGFLYWSGKTDDNLVSQKKMSRLTELVAKLRNEKKTSSYYGNFEKDSISIEKFQISKNPSPNIAVNMNKLIQDEIFEEKIIPLHLFNLEKVNKVIIQPAKDPKKRVLFKYNSKGQLLQFNEGSDSIAITYKDGLPVSSVDRYKNIVNFFYQGDTVIIKKKNDMNIYKLVDKMFFEIKRFDIEKKNYEEMTLNDGSEIKLSKGDKFCVTEYIDARDMATKICYSNTNWQLPLSISNVSSSGSRNNKSELKYSLNDEKKLIVEDLNNYKSTKIEYSLTDGRPTKLQISIKRGEESYNEGYSLDVNYEYFK